MCSLCCCLKAPNLAPNSTHFFLLFVVGKTAMEHLEKKNKARYTVQSAYRVNVGNFVKRVGFPEDRSPYDLLMLSLCWQRQPLERKRPCSAHRTRRAAGEKQDPSWLAAVAHLCARHLLSLPRARTGERAKPGPSHLT